MNPDVPNQPGPIRALFLRALVPFYRQITKKPLRLTNRLTPAGVMLLGLTGITGLIGVDTSRTILYQFFAVGSAILVAGWFSTLFFRPKLKVRRHLPGRGAVGQRLRYTVEVTNQRSREVPELSLIELLPLNHPQPDAFVNEPEPGEKTRNAFDRCFAFYRWRWLVDRAQLFYPQASAPVDVAGQETKHIRLECVPKRRGRLTLNKLGALQSDLFGLIRCLRTIRRSEPASVLIMPKRYTVPELALAGRSEYQPAGSASSSRLGQSEEFVGLRDYRPGDSLRHMHWRTWARTGRPVIKEYVEEFIPRYALILDTFAVRDPYDCFEEAVSVAASFTCELESQESLLDLMFVGTEAYCLTTGRGQNDVERLLDVLAMVELSRSQEFSTLAEHVMARTRALSACVCIFLSATEERQTFVEGLRAIGIPVLPLVVAPPGHPHPAGWHLLEPGRVQAGLLAAGAASRRGRE